MGFPRGPTSETQGRILESPTQTPEWKRDLEDNFRVNAYASADETRRRLDREYSEIKQVMRELGMAKMKQAGALPAAGKAAAIPLSKKPAGTRTTSRAVKR